jgi:hypothetical protein
MRSGDRPGLQNRRAAGTPVAGGFDPHSLPPFFNNLRTRKSLANQFGFGRAIYHLGMGPLHFVRQSVLVIYSTWLDHKAAKTIRLSYELVQREPSPTLDDLRRHFGGDLQQSATCSSAGCGYEITLSNRILAQVHLAPYSALRSAFWVKDGVLEENTLEVWTRASRERMIVAYADAKYCEQCAEFDVVPCEGPKSEIASGSVRVGSRSTPIQERNAFGFNAKCLTTPKGCGSIAELLPTIWDETKEGMMQYAHERTYGE